MWKQIIQQLRRDESGQDLIEYALIAGFVIIAVAIVLPQELMPTVSKIFSSVGSLMARTPA